MEDEPKQKDKKIFDLSEFKDGELTYLGMSSFTIKMERPFTLTFDKDNHVTFTFPSDFKSKKK